MVVVAGSDVGKHNLEVSVAEGRPIRLWRIRNTAPGIGKLSAFLRGQGATRVVCEPTGGYERRPVSRRHWLIPTACGLLPGSAVRSLTNHAKTDLLDAQLLSRYGRMFPEPEPQPTEPERQGLQDLLPDL